MPQRFERKLLMFPDTFCGQVSTASKSKLPFCRQCGKQLVLGVPEGDDRERALCSGCGYVDYMNPKMV